MVDIASQSPAVGGAPELHRKLHGGGHRLVQAGRQHGRSLLGLSRHRPQPLASVHLGLQRLHHGVVSFAAGVAWSGGGQRFSCPASAKSSDRVVEGVTPLGDAPALPGPLVDPPADLLQALPQRSGGDAAKRPGGSGPAPQLARTVATPRPTVNG